MRIGNFVLLLLCLLMVQTTFGQRRLLDHAKKAIYQLDYQDAQTELKAFLDKNMNVENNAYLLLKARCYGDPESPFFRPDTAYAIVNKITYYPSTFDAKMDGVVCKTYKDCVDTVIRRKEQYLRYMLREAIEAKNIDLLKILVAQYSIHTSQIREATKVLYQLEFDKAKKADKILLYSTFVEEYPDAPQVKDANLAIEKLKYERVVRLNTVKEYELFLKSYPDSKYRSAVNQHIEDARWDYCVNGNSIGRYREFISHYPESKYITKAHSNIEELQWQQVLQINESPYYRWFVRTYPQSEHVKSASGKMLSLDWTLAYMSNTAQGYRDFIRLYPNTRESDMAREELSKLKRENAGQQSSE